MTIARGEIIDESQPGVYHITARCVRRAFLCGKDKYSGKNFDYRKVWIGERIRFLVEHFAIDLLSYALMSNHMHLTPRNRPDVARLWSAREVAERWLRVVSTHAMPDAGDEPLEEARIKAITRNPKRVEEIRKRLSSISCFMGKLCESISRRANKEEELTGRFWEGRFKSSRLADKAAILACMAYVDLNPVRAKMADSVQASDYTSGQDRAVAELARRRVREYRRCRRIGEALTDRQKALYSAAHKRAKRADWLVSLQSPDSPLRGVTESSYLELLDWTGRQVRAGKRGKIPDRILPILQDLDINTKRWVSTVEQYGSLFHRMVAKAEEMSKAAKAQGRQWFHGVRACRELYVSDAHST